MHKKFVFILIGAAVLAGGWYFLGSGLSSAETVAVVNGTEITRTDLDDALARFAASQGADLAALDAETRSQLESRTVESLINQELLLQAATDAGIAVTEEEVSGSIASLSAQFSDEEAFRQALEAQGLSLEDFREGLSQDLAIQQYFEQELDLESITVTDADITEAYEASFGAGEGAPALADVREQVEGLIVQQRQQELIETLLQTLRDAAEVEILI